MKNITQEWCQGIWHKPSKQRAAFTWIMKEGELSLCWICTNEIRRIMDSDVKRWSA